MRPSSSSQADAPPAVTDDDIRDVEHSWGVTFDDPRRDILRSNESFDVQACPGSGKTTLLVAKLAILAKKWPHSRRGICVLSHTNVARQEVENKLADTAAGQRLLAYPHFVGTIHAFVNDFLALPILRSDGRTVRLVDDEACFDWMKRHLTSWPVKGKLGNLVFKERTLDSHIRSLVCAGNADALKAPQGVNESQWDALTDAKSRGIERGFWYHADMFAAANRLLNCCPEVTGFARWRFPVVFIDEMQDTSETQNEVLARVFPAEACSLRQRFGDPNQAIYDFGQSRATIDPFPSGSVRTLPNSKRFGPQVAKKAEPLAPISPDPELAGEGPQPGSVGAGVDSAKMPHTIFCFGADSTDQVLPAFARLLVATFPDSVLLSDAFVARVVGRVGKSSAGDGGMPRDIRAYWAGYEPTAAKLEPRSGKLADFLHLAQRERSRTDDCAESVQIAAKGLIELVGKVLPVDAIGKASSMKWLRESMESDKSALRDLQRILWQCCVEVDPISEQGWPGQVAALRQALRSIIGEKWTSDAGEFCNWSAEFAAERTNDAPTALAAPNRYRFTDGGRVVDIDVGTIHGAKGQTHTATLVLETFFKKHDLADLLPWLIGEGSKEKRGSEREDRMRLIYTAMTRPTYLLCLAMRDEALGEGEKREANVNCLQFAGWTVTHL